MKKTVLALTCAVLCAAPALAEEAKKPGGRLAQR